MWGHPAGHHSMTLFGGVQVCSNFVLIFPHVVSHENRMFNDECPDVGPVVFLPFWPFWSAGSG